MNGALTSTMIALPTVGALVLFFVRPRMAAYAAALLFGGAAAVLSIYLAWAGTWSGGEIQFAEQVPWVPSFGIFYTVGLDGLSIPLAVLTTVLTFLVLVAAASVQEKFRSYLGLMLLLETGMLGTFAALDGITFYVFWELMLIPMYFLIGVWGGERRRYAAFKFVLYTAAGSLLMLVAISYLGFAASRELGAPSFLFSDWAKLNFAAREGVWLFSAFAFAFAIKIPMFPLHTWLPDAHVEAPTGGSVILAGVLLKMGLYGLIRICVPVFPEVMLEAQWLFALLGVVGIVYGALVAWMQTDIKKLVAYSSVSHLGFCVLGFAAMNLEGMQGCILQMVNHGVSTGALFFLVGVLYERKHTRKIAAYHGLAAKVPLFCFVYMVFTLSSIALPLTNGFVGEFLILYGGFKFKPALGAVAVLGVILGAVYMLSLYRRLVFGELNQENADLVDLRLREKLVFVPLLVSVFIIGLYPSFILKTSEPAAKQTVGYVQAVAAKALALQTTGGSGRGENVPE